MIETYFNAHNHTHYSNIRLLDAVIKPKALIDKAIELGLSGVAITDHECLGAHIQVNQYAKEIREKYPDFTIALGNEIYLTDTRDSGQRYYHFILIAKDLIGHKALRELSSTAWLGMYVDRGMERVPLLKTELAAIMQKYRGHVLATTACIGGELGQTFLARREARTKEEEARFYEQQLRYIKFCQDVFGDDFYIECAPSTNPDQIYVNQCLYKIAQYFKIPMTVATDSHYLTKDDRLVHKAYLNSKNGEREVDSFYEFTYLMSPKECRTLLKHSFNSEEIVDELFLNTEKMRQSIQFYDLGHQQIIPKIEVTNYPIEESDEWNEDDFPTVSNLLKSSDVQERYWINEVVKGLKDKGFIDNSEYKKRVETEADVIKYIGEQLNDNLFAYFNTFKHYIDLFWKCGSIVGPGRGSSTGFLTNYLLGITQLDPIRWGLQYWRFLNRERSELPDIDIDLAPSKRGSIFKAIRDERGPLGLIQVATFGTEGTKSAILAACRGYRSDEYTAGIDVDIAQYLSSLIPQERGFLWPIADVVHGNQEKGRRPVQPFLDEIQKYPGLLNIIENIEGLVNKRSSHASGVIFYNGDPYDTNAIMRTPSGDLVTCWDLHDSEFAGK